MRVTAFCSGLEVVAITGRATEFNQSQNIRPPPSPAASDLTAACFRSLLYPLALCTFTEKTDTRACASFADLLVGL